jgi:hypothetical protein
MKAASDGPAWPPWRRPGQFSPHDAPLRLEALRQVGIGVQRDAVGPQLRHLGQRAREGLGRLLGQAVDQVHVDGIEADRARRLTS